MKIAAQIGYIICLICIGGNTFAQSSGCPDKIDPQLCDLLSQFEDTTWVGCSIGLKLQPPDPVTDPKKDTTNHHSTYSPAPYLVAEVESLFTDYEIRLPDTIYPSRLVYFPKNTRASVPTITINNYHVFVRKNDILNMGSKEYIGGVWAWGDEGPASVTPFLRNELESRNKGRYFNLNGQRLNGPEFLFGPFLKIKP
jgi:hypothetical protein